MPRRLDGSDRGVLITQESARRIQRVVQRIEGGDRNTHAPPLPTAFDDGDPIRIGKTTSAWNKGTIADIEVRESGTPPNETAGSPVETMEDCVNKFADVPADKWVAVARAGNGRWYLIAAEC